MAREQGVGMSTGRLRTTLGVAAATGLLLVAAGWASASGPSKVFTGCLKAGVISKVAIGTKPQQPCGRAKQVSWSRRGPRGPQGPPGPQGPAGKDGTIVLDGRASIQIPALLPASRSPSNSTAPWIGPSAPIRELVGRPSPRDLSITAAKHFRLEHWLGPSMSREPFETWMCVIGPGTAQRCHPHTRLSSSPTMGQPGSH